MGKYENWCYHSMIIVYHVFQSIKCKQSDFEMYIRGGSKGRGMKAEIQMGSVLSNNLL